MTDESGKVSKLVLIGIATACSLVLAGALTVGVFKVQPKDIVTGHVFTNRPIDYMGQGMLPNIEPGQLSVNNGAYKTKSPMRGDPVVVQQPSVGLLVSRIVGLPGETIEIRQGVVFIDGKVSKQPFKTIGNSPDLSAIRIPAGEFFLLNDNRAAKPDSRTFGPVSRASIRGKVAIQGDD